VFPVDNGQLEAIAEMTAQKDVAGLADRTEDRLQ
jgi:hypothetical protein